MALRLFGYACSTSELLLSMDEPIFWTKFVDHLTHPKFA
jgi:hypothetical protein